jgi:hypothetical protein
VSNSPIAEKQNPSKDRIVTRRTKHNLGVKIKFEQNFLRYAVISHRFASARGDCRSGPFNVTSARSAGPGLGFPGCCLILADGVILTGGVVILHGCIRFATMRLGLLFATQIRGGLHEIDGRFALFF